MVNNADIDEKLTSLCCAIAYYRKEKGLTQQELADMLMISRTHLAGIESANVARPFSARLVFEIANALGIEPNLLFCFETEKR